MKAPTITLYYIMTFLLSCSVTKTSKQPLNTLAEIPSDQLDYESLNQEKYRDLMHNKRVQVSGVIVHGDDIDSASFLRETSLRESIELHINSCASSESVDDLRRTPNKTNVRAIAVYKKWPVNLGVGGTPYGYLNEFMIVKQVNVQANQ